MKTALPRAVGIVLCVLAPWALAQPADDAIEEVVFIDVPRFDEKAVDITIDGVVDEDIWTQVPSYDGLRVTEPDTFAAPVWDNDIRFLYTNRGLYVSGSFEQPPDTLVTRLSGRDFFLNRDEFHITLDTSGVGLYGYWFTAAVGDSVKDGKISPERRFTNEWDGPWLRGTEILEDGWSVEMFLPWSMMAMPEVSGPRELGFWVYRHIAHRDERWSTPHLPFTSSRFMSALGQMRLEEMQPSRQLSFFPFASYTFDDVDNGSRTRAGMDVFWRPSTNFQVTATLKPDFGAVESDDVVVNLTAYETFFPEKRRFFVEGNEVFFTTPRFRSSFFRGFGSSRQTASSFAPSSTTLLNTRRIGSAPDLAAIDGVTFERVESGRPTDLLGAAKVTGQFGGWRYGALAAFEDDVKRRGEIGGEEVVVRQDGRDFGVARLLYESSGAGRWSAGYLGTFVRHPNKDNAVVHGVDAHLLSSDGKFTADAQLMLSDVEGENGFGAFADFSYSPSNHWRHSAKLDYLDSKLDINDLGFLRRNDLRKLEYGVEYNTSKGLKYLRSKRWNINATYAENGEGLFVQGGIFGRHTWAFQNRNEVRLTMRFFPSRYDDRNSLDNGTYKIETRGGFGVEFGTDTSRPLSFSVIAGMAREELGKTNRRVAFGFTYKPNFRFSADFDLSYRRRHGWLLYQQDRDFTRFNATEWRPRVEVDYFISARQQLRFTLQWAGIRADERDFWRVPLGDGKLIPVTRESGAETDDFTISFMTAQLRYRWEIGPLSDLFVVYTRGSNLDNQIDEDFDELFHRAVTEPDVSTFVIKLRYRFPV
tara:strand:+ start:1838 stop:4279 length:2442 start_codon:yes stop_codon:yes gene_type:complete